MSWHSKQFVILWLVASTLHLPFPIPDCDPVETDFGQVAMAAFDLDFILLGCTPPRDADHGPMGRDPNPGNHQIGPFPLYYLTSARSDSEPWQQLVRGSHADDGLLLTAGLIQPLTEWNSPLESRISAQRYGNSFSSAFRIVIRC